MNLFHEGEATTLPILIRAWEEVITHGQPNATLPPRLQAVLDEPETAKRRELIREVYEFLHAQQLVAMTEQLKIMTRSIDEIKKQQENFLTQKQGIFGYMKVFLLFSTGAAIGLLCAKYIKT